MEIILNIYVFILLGHPSIIMMQYKMSDNKLLNPHQSAYCKQKHHSIETALLYIHDHLINAIGSQTYRAFVCLLDLTAAFDIIDHNILITLSHLGSVFVARYSQLV